MAASGELDRGLIGRGATATLFQGVAVCADFGDAQREWRAAREGCVAVPAGYRRCIAATGSDRADFLQGLLSNDVKALVAGAGVYAAALTQTGKVVSDVRVYAAADRLVLDVLAWRETVLREHLQRFLVADDVELEDDVDGQPLLHLEGPLAAAVAGQALGMADLPATPLSHRIVSFDGTPLRVVRVSECGGEGVLVCGPARLAVTILDACREAGACPAGMTALQTVRIEAGVPWAGIDMDEETLLLETGRDAALSFSKGCYLGQEVVERIAARGHVNRRLAGLLLDGEGLPARATPLLADGREVGYVTSAVRSPLLQRGIALGIIHRKHGAPGERLQVGAAGGAATVCELPFAGLPGAEEDVET